MMFVVLPHERHVQWHSDFRGDGSEIGTRVVRVLLGGGRVVDEKRRIVDVVFLFEFTEKHVCMS